MDSIIPIKFRHINLIEEKMARMLELPTASDELKKILTKSLQSGNINFLIGSGASYPAIATVGNVEIEIQKLFEENKIAEANTKIYRFLKCVQEPNNDLVAEKIEKRTGESDPDFKKRKDSIEATLKSYQDFIRVLEQILVERKTNLLPRQANIFTTNYDLFIEKAAEPFPSVMLNDGFHRTPSLRGEHKFSSRTFFNSVFNKGNLYNYRVEIPTINLLKVHGSLSWKKVGEQIIFNCQKRDVVIDESNQAQVEAFNANYSLVLPQKGKFRETIMG